MLSGWDYDNSDYIFSKCDKEVDITQQKHNTISFLHLKNANNLSISTSVKNSTHSNNRSPSEVRKRYSNQYPTKSTPNVKKQLLFSRKTTLRSTKHNQYNESDCYGTQGIKKITINLKTATLMNCRKIRQPSIINDTSKSELYKLPPLFLKKPINIKNLEVGNDYTIYTTSKAKNSLRLSAHQRILDCIKSNGKSLIPKEANCEKINHTINISVLNKCNLLEQKLKKLILSNMKL